MLWDYYYSDKNVEFERATVDQPFQVLCLFSIKLFYLLSILAIIRHSLFPVVSFCLFSILIEKQPMEVTMIQVPCWVVFQTETKIQLDCHIISFNIC